MTEVGEAVLVSMLMSDEESEQCDFKAEDENWKANLDGNSKTLGDNIGDKPKAATKESELSPSRWPAEAHHLIPWKTLQKHSVAGWLKKSVSGSELWGDTFYNVDHENNGRWLPNAAELEEWRKWKGKKGKRRDLMFKVMSLSGLQLHQGPHSGKNRYEVGEQPYKMAVADYLDKIEENAISHYNKEPPCEDCKGNSKKGKVPPRANTVSHVDMASELLWGDIVEGRIFVSRIAAEFAETMGDG